MSAEMKKYPKLLPAYESEALRERRLRSTAISAQALAQLRLLRAMKKMSAPPQEPKDSLFLRKDPNMLLASLRQYLSGEIDFVAALNETVQVFKEVTHSDKAVAYMVDETMDVIYQITGTRIDDTHRVSYKIGTGTTVAAHVAYEKQYVKMDDLLEDPRFPDGLGVSDVTVKAVLCVPIVTVDGDCLAVFEMYRHLEGKPYNDQELTYVVVACGWISTGIYQHQQRGVLQKQQELNDRLIKLAKLYFTETLTFDKFVTDVMNFAKETLNGEHSIFYVLKKSEHGELMAECYEEGLGVNKDVFYKKDKNTKFGSNDVDVNSLVVNKRITINVRNASQDFPKLQNKQRTYTTRTVLCMPVSDVNDIQGIIQMINKKKGSYFTKSDETLFQTFGGYCGLVLSYAQLRDKTATYNSQNRIYSKILAKHISPCIHDDNFLLNHPDIKTLPQRFHQFDFYITDSFITYMPQMVIYMFDEISKSIFRDINTMTNFILIVQKSYHARPYHNFFHAFNVCHSIYLMLRRNMDLFTHIELQALILAALCHDIDHYALTNNFLEITNHPISQLYGDSPLENHHYNVTIFIIKKLDLFSDLTPAEYLEIQTEIRDAILATDLATYFKRRGRLYQICTEKNYDWKNQTHRLLLKSVMMTAADLSGLCKPFPVAKLLTDSVYKEFYNEGDLEKAMGLPPLSIMDREKTNMIPSDQVQFLTVVVLPCVLILTKILPNCAAMYKEAIKLREIWQHIFDSQGLKLWVLD